MEGVELFKSDSWVSSKFLLAIVSRDRLLIHLMLMSRLKLATRGQVKI